MPPPKHKINVPAPGKRFICTYCQKSFTHEHRFLEHECKQKKRLAEMQTPVGQTAYQHYQQWMRIQHRHSSGPASFLASKYYVTFVKFAKFVQKINLPDADLFIKLMVQKTLPPTLWMNDSVYSVYLDFLDKKLTPQQHAQISIDTLFKYAENHGVDVSEVFDLLHPNEIIALIRERRLSPWLLLFSASFKRLLTERASPEQRIILETIIHPEVWAEKIASHPDAVRNLKKFAKELGI